MYKKRKEGEVKMNKIKKIMFAFLVLTLISYNAKPKNVCTYITDDGRYIIVECEEYIPETPMQKNGGTWED